MKKKIIKITSIVFVVLIAITGWIAFCGYQWSWGPFSKLMNLRCANMEGNSAVYAVETVESIEKSPLKGKNILFLGSSVTYGAHSLQTSFVEFIAQRNGCTYVKEAVPGTTLVDNRLDSYVSRLKMVDKSQKFDLFVCQLSTNDASQKKELGEIDSTDTKTVCGAINFICGYVQETWNCPIVFYTGSYYESERYSAMVDSLLAMEKQGKMTVVNLYTDKSFNDIKKEDYALYMSDSIHPTQAGYLKWWTPKIEEVLFEVVNASN